MSHVRVFRFDTRTFPFRTLLEELFGAAPLEELHRFFPDESKIKELPDRFTDDKTFAHERFYRRLEAGWSEFETLHESFVRQVGRRHFKGAPFVYQHRSTLRVQLPGSLAVAEFHRDSDYNHPHGEINFMVSLTRAFDTNAMWIESEPGKGDYRPIALEYGEVAQFDGSACSHGNKVNRTGKTRVSFDFRLLSVEDYRKAEPQRSIGAGLPFTVGGYYRQAGPDVPPHGP